MTGPTAPAPQPSRGRRAFQWASLAAIVVIPIAVAAWLLSPKATCACSPTPAPTGELPASPVIGIVIAVDSQGLGQVRGFTLRGEGGVDYALQLGRLENPTEFSPSHLTEHMASSQPIRAFYRLENGLPTVYRLEDATAASPS